MERTLLLVKPDAVMRGLVGKIIARFEEKGFKILGLKFLWMSRAQAEELYKPHVGKSFYEPTVKYMTSSPITAMVLEGYDCISQVRTLMGATRPVEAVPGSIRGDFAQRVDRNAVHGSDSAESAAREIPIFFKDDEIVKYTHHVEAWI